MTAGIWLSLALAALIGEFLSGTFYLLVVAAAFALAAASHWLGLPLIAQLVVASVSAVTGVALLRHWRRRPHRHPHASDDDPDIGQRVEVVSRHGDGSARVRFRGAHWDARLQGELDAGQTAIITARDGNLLIVAPLPTKETP